LGQALQPHGGEDDSNIQVIIREIVDIGREEPRLIEHADDWQEACRSKSLDGDGR